VIYFSETEHGGIPILLCATSIFVNGYLTQSGVCEWWFSDPSGRGEFVNVIFISSSVCLPKCGKVSKLFE
jgi:hypothetical protein